MVGMLQNPRNSCACRTTHRRREETGDLIGELVIVLPQVGDGEPAGAGRAAARRVGRQAVRTIYVAARQGEHAALQRRGVWAARRHKTLQRIAPEGMVRDGREVPTIT